MKDTLGVLLAGGAGERLFPLTRDRAKPAVPFGGNYRIIDITLSNCINSDLRRVYILTQYKALSLNRHIREGWTGIMAQELGEFFELLPPMQRTGSNWYMGPSNALNCCLSTTTGTPLWMYPQQRDGHPGTQDPSPYSLLASPCPVEARKSNFAPTGSARSMSPDRVWTSIFGRFLPGFRSISPRSKVKSNDCVNSESCTSLE